jgi:hypothetical protein
MPKEKSTKAVQLLGSPANLINLLVIEPQDKKKVIKKITNGGPSHKQLQHTLVLNRLNKLASLLKKRTGLAPKHLEGRNIKTENKGEFLPIQIPSLSIGKTPITEKAYDALTKGPEHEILYTALLLQMIENMIIAEESKPATIKKKV